MPRPLPRPLHLGKANHFPKHGISCTRSLDLAPARWMRGKVDRPFRAHPEQVSSWRNALAGPAHWCGQSGVLQSLHVCPRQSGATDAVVPIPATGPPPGHSRPCSTKLMTCGNHSADAHLGGGGGTSKTSAAACGGPVWVGDRESRPPRPPPTPPVCAAVQWRTSPSTPWLRHRGGVIMRKRAQHTRMRSAGGSAEFSVSGEAICETCFVCLPPPWLKTCISVHTTQNHLRARSWGKVCNVLYGHRKTAGGLDRCLRERAALPEDLPPPPDPTMANELSHPVTERRRCAPHSAPLSVAVAPPTRCPRSHFLLRKTSTILTCVIAHAH